MAGREHPPTNGASHAPRGLAAAGVDYKALPNNTAIEASIIGGVIVHNEVLAELAELETDDFYDMRHKAIWQAVRNLEAAQKPIDVLMLEVEIEKVEKLDAVGGVAYLGIIALQSAIPEIVVSYADQVRRLRRNRDAIVTLASALHRAKTWPHDPAELILEVAADLQRSEAEHVSAHEGKKTIWCVPLEEFLGDEEPDDNDAEDWIMRDLVPRGEPLLWGGPMKSGKTWSAMSLLIAVALGQSWLGKFENTLGEPAKCLGVFLEDNTRRARKRLWELCRAIGITPNDPVLRANLRISRKPLRLPDPAHQRRLTAEIKAWGAKFALIDNLTRVMVGDPNKTTDAAAFTRAWSEINDETNCTIGFLHHTKKPSGDQASADPFDQLRGSGDFGATARNIVVSTPIRTEGEMVSEVRMRGNLDLRRESFVLGFERVHMLDRWQARLSDRGDVEAVKEGAAKAKKENKEQKKKQELLDERSRRRAKALELMHKNGYVTLEHLGLEFGKSANTMKPTMDELIDSGLARKAGKKGYEITREQGDLRL